MSSSQDRILEMLSAGTITPAEATELLEALRGPSEKHLDWIFQPMKRLTTAQALALAGGAALLQLLTSRFQIRFDGALDLHLVSAAVPWATALVDLVLTWPVTALILFAVARPIAGQGRLVDFLSTVNVARIPLIASGLLSGVLRDHFLRDPGGLSVAAFAVTLVVVLCAAWHLTLLVTGVRTVTGLRGGKLALALVVGLVLAEVLTKFALKIL